MAEQPFLISSAPWVQVHDGNPTAISIFRRHYSARKTPPRIQQFVGPGEKMVLLTPDARALFVWRREKFRLDEQAGINCAVFRNEGASLSSTLIRSAVDFAWARWPGERLFTFVNQRMIKSGNPGYCFIAAGWRGVGWSKTKRLRILELLP